MKLSSMLWSCQFDLWNQTQHEPQLARFDEDMRIEVEGHHGGTGNGRAW